MIFRRDFLQRSLAAGAIALLPAPLQAGTAAAVSGSGLPLLRPAFLVHDQRQAASLALARDLGRHLLGATQLPDGLLRAVPGDVTRFWSDELQPLWRQQRAAVAGTTAADQLFCLQQLARDHRLRVVWSRRHDGEGSVPLVSWLIAAA